MQTKFWAWAEANPRTYIAGIVVITCGLAVVYG